MSYEKYTWAAESPITAAALNHLEYQYYYMKLLSDTHNHDDQFYTKTLADARYFHTGFMGQGSGFDADELDGYHGAELAGAGLPIGAIVPWSGASGEVPTGWAICNGQISNEYQTPDLRDKFVIGAGGSYNPGATGGATTFTPTASGGAVSSHALTLDEMAAHTHTWLDSSPVLWSGSNTGWNAITTVNYTQKATTAAGGGQGHVHAASGFSFNAATAFPLYYALYIIMRTA